MQESVAASPVAGPDILLAVLHENTWECLAPMKSDLGPVLGRQGTSCRADYNASSFAWTHIGPCMQLDPHQIKCKIERTLPGKELQVGP